MRIEQLVSIEGESFRDQVVESGFGRRPERAEHRAERGRKLARAQGKLGEDAEGAAATALDGPEQVGMVACIHHEDAAVRRDDFRLEESGCAQPILLRKAAKPATVNEAGDTHGGASAALHIASAPRRDGIVDREPTCPGLNRDRRLRSVRSIAADRDERIVQRDCAHLARPYQERIGRIRRALIAMAAALDDEAQIVFPRKIDGCNDIGRRARFDGIGARRGIPCVHPARGFGQRRALADEVGIAQLLEEGLAGGAVGCRATGGERVVQPDETTADGIEQRIPSFLGWPRDIAGTHPGKWPRRAGCDHRSCRARE